MMGVVRGKGRRLAAGACQTVVVALLSSALVASASFAQADCRHDLMFMMDSSGTIGASNFDLIKEIVTELIETQLLYTSNVSVISFSDTQEEVVHFGIDQEPALMTAAVDATSFQRGLSTPNTSLNFAIDEFATESDPEYQKTILLFVDNIGYRSQRVCHNNDMKDALDSADITVYVIGVGSYYSSDDFDCLVDDRETQMTTLEEFDSGFWTDLVLDGDFDTVCDDEDVCPGEDDLLDTDFDGAPDCLDRCQGFDDVALIDQVNGTCLDLCDGTIPIDSDADGVPDVCDVCPGQSDFGPDEDGDSVPDHCEKCPEGNDFLDADADTVPDACDVCDGDDTLDSDGDDVPDECDECPGGDDSVDTDSDGVPSFCDVCEGSDDEHEDADNDTVPDGCDQCPGENDLADTDADGVPDACDICLTGDDNADADDDGVPNACDLCVGDDRTDSDDDGTPDVCDACEGSSDSEDADDDGVPDGCDACPTGDDTLDDDTDGVPDACDQCAGGDDAVDTDGDGTADGCDACPEDADDECEDEAPGGCDDGECEDGAPGGCNVGGSGNGSAFVLVLLALGHLWRRIVLREGPCPD